MALTSLSLATHLLLAFATLLAFTDAGNASDCNTTVHNDPKVTWQTTKCCPPGPLFSKANDTLFMNYNGTFLNGTLFDSSYSPQKPWPAGDPFHFTLGAKQVVAGFDAGLYNMCPGEIRSLKIAPEFAYGTKGTSDGAIPPNSTLAFSVELMAIRNAAKRVRLHNRN
ncbi:hypothetical protein EG328_009648 [Venturia inaequalis]|uniref:peptidylprolyl isomerase n=1 Tax=Venturia inaequalis TaxID=5025 RepID=A0A8H3V0P3_VENIN|nr:hypothetical protein EG328_009648 [Venturia inaequalis]KAE9979260.1 hypothetical protein EG327_007078 [Venturia inaequalis]